MGRGRAKRDETVTIITNNNDDEDSFGPTPPPPSHPHPDDLLPNSSISRGGAEEGGAYDGRNADAILQSGDDEDVDVDFQAGNGQQGYKKKPWTILGFGSRAAGRGSNNKPEDPQNSVQIQGIEDVLKDDPPGTSKAGTIENEEEEDDYEGGGGGRGGRLGRRGKGGGRDDTEDDNELDEDMSVEIPPTTVVQRMKHREENDAVKRLDNGRWARVGGIAACLLVVLAVILGVGYGSGAFQSSSRSASGGNGGGGGGSSDPNRPAAVTSYLQSITTEPDAYFGNSTNATDPGTLSANWLVNDDPLQLSPDTEAGMFRLKQRYALLTLWFSSRSYWANSTGWAAAEDECMWLGVTCEPAQLEGAGEVNVVTRLSLDGNGVQALSSDLFLLDNLKILSLADNVIVGPLPPTLANASSLVELYLETNGLQQDLSDFDWSGLLNLEVLRLGDNVGLNGTLNDSLWTLPKLQELALNGCRFQGEIGAAVENLQSLVVFDVSNNRGGNRAGFSGTLPTVFASLPNLEVLGLGGNRFEGSIPSEYAAMPELSELNVADNQLTGSLLEDWVTSTSLKVLRVGGNAGLGGGTIPSFLYDMTSLQVLDIGGLNLDGQIDPTVANLVNLVEFNVSGNALTGAPPTEMGSLTGLETLQMGSNFLSGPLDFVAALGALTDLNVETNLFTGFSDLSGLSSLKSLRASRNDFAGTFPDAVASLPSLAYLDLSSSGLTGALPSSLGNLAGLEQLILTDNSLTGPIPDTISGMTSLLVLKLDGNALSSSLPATITSLSNLRELELQQNRIGGPLPADMGAMYSLRRFRINNNSDNNDASSGITGPLPASLSNMKFLEVLEVFSNRMTGTLPPEMGSMGRLRYLDIEFNGFTGTIPAEWSGMSSLEEFYLSSTQLTGSMPEQICDIAALRFLVPDCSITDCGCCSTCQN